MYKILFFLVVTLSLFKGDSGRLVVNVEGLTDVKGSMYVGIYRTESAFGFPDSVYRSSIVKIKDKDVSVVFDNLPFGQYAITLFQDLNNNQALDKNLLGIPTEPYGFSNNPKILLRPPEWQDCVFTHDVESMDLSIILK